MGWDRRASSRFCSALLVTLLAVLGLGAPAFAEPSANLAGSESTDPSLSAARIESSGSQAQPVWE